MKPKLTIVKTGGALLNNAESRRNLLRSFAALSGKKILVHGGGQKATEIAARLGVRATLLNGRRITDEPMLEVTVMVYGGLLNRQLVADLQAIGCNAIGLSGADANIIGAHKRRVDEIDYGFAGDIDRINTQTLHALLNSGLTPVICSLTHDGKGQLLNTNADTIAAAVAIGCTEYCDTELLYCSDGPGVLDDSRNTIREMNSKEIETLTEAGVITKGMLPKLETAVETLKKGVKNVRIGDWRCIQNEQAGTKIRNLQYEGISKSV